MERSAESFIFPKNSYFYTNNGKAPPPSRYHYALFNKFLRVLSSESAVIFKEYSARENYDYFGSAKYLSNKLKNSIYIEDLNGLLYAIKTSKKNNILILGAGNLYDKIKKYTKNYTVW